MNITNMSELLIANFFPRYTKLANQLGAVNLAQGIPEPLMELDSGLGKASAAGWQYTDPQGLESLRTALSQEYDNVFHPEQILITSGCTESLYLGVFAASQLYGKKIAFIEPFYPYYICLAKLLNMEAIPTQMLKNNHGSLQPDWQQIEQVIQAGVRILIINTPHNPSGWSMSIDEAIYLRKLADQYGILLIVDEAYRYYTYDMLYTNKPLQILYTNNENILILGSASKLLSATGLRIGWMLGQKNLMDIAYTIHLYTTYCHPAPLQKLVADILSQRDTNWFADTKKHYSKKRDKLFNALSAVGLSCAKADGGHFLLADFSAINNDMDSEQFVDYFAHKYGVMPLPGSIFYTNKLMCKQVRFSFSVTMETIDKAVTRLTHNKNSFNI